VASAVPALRALHARARGHAAAPGPGAPALHPMKDISLTRVRLPRAASRAALAGALRPRVETPRAPRPRTEKPSRRLQSRRALPLRSPSARVNLAARPARHALARNTKRISAPATQSSLHTGLFNRGPAARCGEAERSEFGAVFIFV